MKVRPFLSYWPFAALCALLSARWVFTSTWPQTESSVTSLAIAAAVAAAVCLLMTGSKKKDPAEKWHWPWSAFAAGALLFGGINAGLLAGSVSPRASDLLIALALVPAVVAVAIVARGQAGAGLNGIDVAPGMLAPAGLLLILPQPVFRSLAESAALLCAPLCAGLGAVLLRGQTDESFPWRRAAMAFSGVAALFAMVSLFPPQVVFSISAVGLDLAIMALTMLSLTRLGARKFSAQFALVPLLLLVQGLIPALVMARIGPTWKQVGGLVMLLLGAVLLLRRRQELQDGASVHLNA